MKYIISDDKKTLQIVASSQRDQDALIQFYKGLGDGDNGNVMLKFKAASLKQGPNSYILFEISHEESKDEYTL